MKKGNSKKRKRRSGVTGFVICCAAIITLIGAYSFKGQREQVEKEFAQIEKDRKKEENSRAEKAQSLTIHNEREREHKEKEIRDRDMARGKKKYQEELQKEQKNIEKEKQENRTLPENKPQFAAFEEGQKLLWPVNGQVLMEYSMDKSVYFSTLDQYQYNPAMILQATVGDQVISACSGLVKSIDNFPRTGTTVTVDIGNGYELIYGQLKAVRVKTGDVLESKTIIGFVSEPTRYFGEEGSNIYFAMRKEGQPVNPREYLTETEE